MVVELVGLLNGQIPLFAVHDTNNFVKRHKRHFYNQRPTEHVLLNYC